MTGVVHTSRAPVLPARALAPVDHVDPARVKAIMEKVRQIEIRTRGLVASSLAGGYQAAFRGRGIDFDRVREYVPGDEVRTIDWNVTARAGHPFVKEFREERELTLMLLVDVSASGEFGSTTVRKRELAAELACVLAMSAIRNNSDQGRPDPVQRPDRALRPGLRPRVARTRSAWSARSSVADPPASAPTSPAPFASQARCYASGR